MSRERPTIAELVKLRDDLVWFTHDGELQFRYPSAEPTYHALDELIRLRAVMAAAVAEFAGGSW